MRSTRATYAFDQPSGSAIWRIESRIRIRNIAVPTDLREQHRMLDMFHDIRAVTDQFPGLCDFAKQARAILKPAPPNDAAGLVLL